MPSKSFYTQGLAILLRQAATLDTIASCLSGFTIVSRRDESTDWHLSGPSLVIAYRPEINGYVLVDVVDRPWPDQMGDPKTELELLVPAHFGCATPVELAREVHGGRIPWHRLGELELSEASVLVVESDGIAPIGPSLASSGVS